MRNLIPASRTSGRLSLAGPLLLVLFLATALSGCKVKLNPTQLDTTAVRLTSVPGQVAFRDMAYDSKLGKVIVPAGGSGRIALVDRDTTRVNYISGLGQPDANGQAVGLSAVVARGLIFSVDQGSIGLYVTDPSSGKALGSMALQAGPDRIRYVAATNELWVTEPSKQQIEVLRIPDSNPPIPVSVGVVSVPGGPEGLVIHRTRGVAYTNQPTIGKTVVIQVQTRGIIAEWGNGCSKARGMALDEQDGMLFVACNEGKLVMLDTTNGGQQVANQNYGGDLDEIAYNSHLRHVYVPSGASAIVAVFGIEEATASSGSTPATSPPTTPATPDSTAAGEPEINLVRLGTADTAMGSSCVTSDDHDNIWVCDPRKGQLLLIKDTFPGSGTG